MKSLHDVLIHIIEEQRQKENTKDIWKESPYRDIVKLQCNNIGIVGEKLIHTICQSAHIQACCDGSKTRQPGGGNGDGTILGKIIEIKTAHQGSTSSTFQHELGEVPWKGAAYMLFIDISPKFLYDRI